jgi:hypothetical protein
LEVLVGNIQLIKETPELLWSVGPDYEGVAHIMEPAWGLSSAISSEFSRKKLLVIISHNHSVSLLVEVAAEPERYLGVSLSNYLLGRPKFFLICIQVRSETPLKLIRIS